MQQAGLVIKPLLIRRESHAARTNVQTARALASGFILRISAMNPSLFRAISVVGFSNISILLVSFLRSVILARSLSPHEFGMALLLVTIMAGLDLLLDGGIDQFIVQNRFGGRRDVVAVAQTYRLASATAAAIALITASDVLSQWLNAPELTTPIKCLAAIAILRAFTNLAYKQQQREGRFSHEAIIDIGRFSIELVVLLAFLNLSLGYWLVVISMAANAIVQAMLSNLVFGTDWRAPLNRRALNVVGAFAFPITLNAILLFAALQGDRLIIANGLSPAEVAVYAAVATFGQAGTTLLLRLTSSLTLARFGAGRYVQPAAKSNAIKVHIGFVFGSMILAFGLAFVVPTLVPLIYGEQYLGYPELAAALACVSALQVEQGWLTALLMSAGRTRTFPFLTAIRALSLPLAGFAMTLEQPLVAVALAALIGTQMAILPCYAILAKMGLVSRLSIGLGLGRSFAAVGMFAWLLVP